MNVSTSPTKIRPMDAKLKNKVLKACLEIKGRTRKKLDGGDGLCIAIFNLLNNPDDMDYYATAYLVQYLSWEMFGESKYGPYVSERYKWTPRRAKLLDKLIETLSGSEWKKMVKLAQKWKEARVGNRWFI